MSLSERARIVEAVLFLESDAIDPGAIAEAANLSKEDTLQAIAELRDAYRDQGHGIDISEVGGRFILSPAAGLWDSLRERYGKRNENKLSRAALETVAIIAYSQPVTRGEIESIRGVSADGMIRSLLDRGLIREAGKKEAPGKPMQYSTTRDFLAVFQLKSIADLPKLGDVDREKFELEHE